MTVEPLQLPPLYPAQHRAICDPVRFSVIEASTKSGKTLGCLLWLLALAWNEGRPGRNYWWVAPIRETAKSIGYARMTQMLYQADPEKRVWTCSDGELWVKLLNGSRIVFRGGDKPDSLYGDDVYGAVVDEATRCKPAVWHALRSTLTATRGPARIIGNIKGSKTWVYRLGRSGDSEVALHRLTAYDAAAGGILSPDEIEAARRQLPPDVFRELYEAQAADTAGGMFYAFDYERNVRPVEYQPDRPIVVGSDFNVNPMAWVLGHRTRDRLEIFDELFVRDTNTPRTLDTLWKKHALHRGGWEFYGDATGRQRKSSASFSDYQHIHNDRRFLVAGRSLHYLGSNPRVKDRVSSCNALFCNADGHARLFVDPSCANLIQDLEYRQWKDDGVTPDDAKGSDSGHASDALGYVVHKVFPLTTIVERKSAPVIIV